MVNDLSSAGKDFSFELFCSIVLDMVDLPDMMPCYTHLRYETFDYYSLSIMELLNEI